MSDLSIMWKDGEGDVVSLDSALLTDDSLTNAIVISLFTDARVDNQRGWWGNDFNQNEERQVEMGSHLWTLARSKQLADVLDDAQAYAEQALQWLIDDGHALAIDVIATNPEQSVLLLSVVVTLPNGQTEQRTFSAVWSL
ncbi:phage GP46 family protein [Haemophilus haemolyticus]|uniref:Phage GP46 family protein n=1 Tax=Haemophilus haemolyticus TaxID=726 RepID=A0A852Q2J2_HAEHA|nr:phage GP46 family protein [Haemophilus haemolyticus]MCK9097492.1 phage GP46 family protein [Haemophilus influenzae]MCK9121649.1 phage GP46 family protein [Haemophilus influenzae]NYA27569.1 phage GP46 family protein [Haemophilus haemolyticus]